MRENISKFSESVFSIFTLLAVVGGGVVFVMFVLGILIGGETGTSLAVNAKSTVMPMFIRFAAVAVLAGLINYYSTGDHALTMDDNN